MNLKLINKESGEDPAHNHQVVAQFLYDHLDQYGDKLEDIRKAIDYVFAPNRGGFIVLGLENETIIGAVVVNETGMSGYIPENILVYIAVDQEMRGKGVGKRLMQYALETASGQVALHVEPDNPARHLYENLGFTNKYLEMRYQKS